MKINILLRFLIVFNAITFYAQTSSSLTVHDTRAINDLPNFHKHGIRADFKERNIIGAPGGGFYSTN